MPQLHGLGEEKKKKKKKKKYFLINKLDFIILHSRGEEKMTEKYFNLKKSIS
jgi:hypothetical protein